MQLPVRFHKRYFRLPSFFLWRPEMSHFPKGSIRIYTKYFQVLPCISFQDLPLLNLQNILPGCSLDLLSESNLPRHGSSFLQSLPTEFFLHNSIEASAAENAEQVAIRNAHARKAAL